MTSSLKAVLSIWPRRLMIETVVGRYVAVSS